ncbi:MAG TPA: cytochrome c3 family protein [Polyangiaceae bacterium]|nr:cytochrome c3 family protein [Polyangiaceae bacterium]
MNARVLIVACMVAALAGALRPAEAVTASKAEASGMHPLANDKAVPVKWLPPGANDPDNGPSSVVFPPQKLTIRFNHKKHVKEVGAKCESCHSKAKTSKSADDGLLPPGTTCDACHDTDHSDKKAVKPGSEDMGQCAFCHLGYRASSPNQVAMVDIPKPNMRFNHKAHLDKNINCSQCHGSIDELELATRDQLPRMKGCFGCHNMSGPAKGGAKSDCNVCHVTETDGRMKSMFATGELKPPRWLSNAQHTPDFLERHKRVAADNSALCANCHTERFCTDCHDGKIRPRSVHPNDWISMHPIAARQDNPKCTSCHQEQSFCLGCHQRAGVTMSGPNVQGHKFHPPGWIEGLASASRGPGHHAWEAQRNLNACVSCHTERDCAMCHAASGRGGLGVNPHPPSFKSDCGTQFRKNNRPCLTCHDVDSTQISDCR